MMLKVRGDPQTSVRRHNKEEEMDQIEEGGEVEGGGEVKEE